MPSKEARSAPDPSTARGIVSAGLGTLGGTIGSGIFLGRIDPGRLAPPGLTKAVITGGDGNLVQAVTTTTIDTAAAIGLGAVVGATAAVMGGLVGAIVVKIVASMNDPVKPGPRRKARQDFRQSVWMLAILGAVVGAFTGVAVGVGFGLLAPRIGIVEGFYHRIPYRRHFRPVGFNRFLNCRRFPRKRRWPAAGRNRDSNPLNCHSVHDFC